MDLHDEIRKFCSCIGGIILEEWSSHSVSSKRTSPTFNASRMLRPRVSRLALVDFTTDAKSQSAWWGYSRMTLLISFDKMRNTFALPCPTRETICGNAVNHWREVEYSPVLKRDVTCLIHRNTVNSGGNSTINFRVKSVARYLRIFATIQPEREDARNSLINILRTMHHCL